MKFVETKIWDIPDFDYFKNELNWNINNIQDLNEQLADLNEQDKLFMFWNYDYKSNILP